MSAAPRTNCSGRWSLRDAASRTNTNPIVHCASAALRIHQPWFVATVRENTVPRLPSPFSSTQQPFHCHVEQRLGVLQSVYSFLLQSTVFNLCFNVITFAIITKRIFYTLVDFLRKRDGSPIGVRQVLQHAPEFYQPPSLRPPPEPDSTFRMVKSIGYGCFLMMLIGFASEMTLQRWFTQAHIQCAAESHQIYLIRPPPDPDPVPNILPGCQWTLHREVTEFSNEIVIRSDLFQWEQSYDVASCLEPREQAHPLHKARTTWPVQFASFGVAIIGSAPFQTVDIAPVDPLHIGNETVLAPFGNWRQLPQRELVFGLFRDESSSDFGCLLVYRKLLLFLRRRLWVDGFRQFSRLRFRVILLCAGIPRISVSKQYHVGTTVRSDSPSLLGHAKKVLFGHSSGLTLALSDDTDSHHGKIVLGMSFESVLGMIDLDNAWAEGTVDGVRLPNPYGLANDDIECVTSGKMLSDQDPRTLNPMIAHQSCIIPNNTLWGIVVVGYFMPRSVFTSITCLDNTSSGGTRWAQQEYLLLIASAASQKLHMDYSTASSELSTDTFEPLLHIMPAHSGLLFILASIGIIIVIHILSHLTSRVSPRGVLPVPRHAPESHRPPSTRPPPKPDSRCSVTMLIVTWISVPFAFSIDRLSMKHMACASRLHQGTCSFLAIERLPTSSSLQTPTSKGSNQNDTPTDATDLLYPISSFILSAEPPYFETLVCDVSTNSSLVTPSGCIQSKPHLLGFQRENYLANLALSPHTFRVAPIVEQQCSPKNALLTSWCRNRWGASDYRSIALYDESNPTLATSNNLQTTCLSESVLHLYKPHKVKMIYSSRYVQGRAKMIEIRQAQVDANRMSWTMLECFVVLGHTVETLCSNCINLVSSVDPATSRLALMAPRNCCGVFMDSAKDKRYIGVADRSSYITDSTGRFSCWQRWISTRSCLRVSSSSKLSSHNSNDGTHSVAISSSLIHPKSILSHRTFVGAVRWPSLSFSKVCNSNPSRLMISMIWLGANRKFSSAHRKSQFITLQLVDFTKHQAQNISPRSPGCLDAVTKYQFLESSFLQSWNYWRALACKFVTTTHVTSNLASEILADSCNPAFGSAPFYAINSFVAAGSFARPLRTLTPAYQGFKSLSQRGALATNSQARKQHFRHLALEINYLDLISMQLVSQEQLVGYQKEQKNVLQFRRPCCTCRVQMNTLSDGSFDQICPTRNDLGTTYSCVLAPAITDVDSLLLSSAQFDIIICDYEGLGATFIRVLDFIDKLYTAVGASPNRIDVSLYAASVLSFSERASLSSNKLVNCVGSNDVTVAAGTNICNDHLATECCLLGRELMLASLTSSRVHLDITDPPFIVSKCLTVDSETCKLEHTIFDEIQRLCSIQREPCDSPPALPHSDEVLLQALRRQSLTGNDANCPWTDSFLVQCEARITPNLCYGSFGHAVRPITSSKHKVLLGNMFYHWNKFLSAYSSGFEGIFAKETCLHLTTHQQYHCAKFGWLQQKACSSSNSPCCHVPFSLPYDVSQHQSFSVHTSTDSHSWYIFPFTFEARKKVVETTCCWARSKETWSTSVLVFEIDVLGHKWSTFRRCGSSLAFQSSKETQSEAVSWLAFGAGSLHRQSVDLAKLFLGAVVAIPAQTLDLNQIDGCTSSILSLQREDCARDCDGLVMTCIAASRPHNLCLSSINHGPVKHSPGYILRHISAIATIGHDSLSNSDTHLRDGDDGVIIIPHMLQQDDVALAVDQKKNIVVIVDQTKELLLQSKTSNVIIFIHQQSNSSQDYIWLHRHIISSYTIREPECFDPSNDTSHYSSSFNSSRGSTVVLVIALSLFWLQRESWKTLMHSSVRPFQNDKVILKAREGVWRENWHMFSRQIRLASSLLFGLDSALLIVR